MIPKGLGDIKGLRTLNTRPGPINNTSCFLRLYQLSAEKSSLIKKREWLNRQKEQTDTRLSDLAASTHAIERHTQQEQRTNTLDDLHHPFIHY